MKTSVEKMVNRKVRRFNRSLAQDVFGKRFMVRQYSKARTEGVSWFLYELIDNEQPERNYLVSGWLNEFDVIRKVAKEMNDFIIRSDFWSKYHNRPEQYNKEMDIYLK